MTSWGPPAVTSQHRREASELTAGAGIQDMPGPAAPMAVARELYARWYGPGPLRLIHHRGAFLAWTGPQWREQENAEVNAWIYRALEDEKYMHIGANGAEQRAWNPNTTKVNQVRDALAAITHLSDQTEAPAWIGVGPAPWTGAVVACRNTLLDLDARAQRELTPELFNLVSTPFDYNPSAALPTRWLEFLSELWPDDPESIAALQMWIGYVVSGRTDLHKILLLVGPSRSGKGTVARVVEQLVGRGNTASPTLSSLGTNFGLAPLIGKPLAVIGDARLAGRTDSSPVVERLLSVSGEDTLTVDRKHRDAWTGRLPTRFMVLSNELPRLGDSSGAVAGRFVTLVLRRDWRGREDTTLGPALAAEAPGILNWALAGLDALTARGALVEPRSSHDAVTALQELSSPTKAFVAECCEIGGDAPVTEVWMRWRTWAADNGHTQGSITTFSRNLKAALPTVHTVQRGPRGQQVRHFSGIRLTATSPLAFPSPNPSTGWGPR